MTTPDQHQHDVDAEYERLDIEARRRFLATQRFSIGTPSPSADLDIIADLTLFDIGDTK